MLGHRHSSIAAEGWPWLAAAAVLGLLVWLRLGVIWALPWGVLTVWLYMLFRDPQRTVPPLPLAVVAPVDGRVKAVGEVADEALPGRWTRIVIRASHLGSYTVRAPVEGTVLDVRERTQRRDIAGLWLRTEEGDEVVLLFPGRRRLGPRAFVGYGGRLGQGQRFAYLRFAPRAEIYVAVTARLQVAPGDWVRAGADVVAELIHD